MFDRPYIIKDCEIIDSLPDEPSFGIQVYEVIRFIDGIPVFFDEHLHRFITSCSSANLNFRPDRRTFAHQLVDLARMNGILNHNLKYSINVVPEGRTFYAGFIPSHYPTAQMYRDGVLVGVLAEERANPNAKILNRSVREKADALMKSTGAYEVALVNQDGKITEGSRSNLFFTDNLNRIYTAPISTVLGGITRQVVIEEIRKLGVVVVEEMLDVARLDSVKSAFITGTSPSVLPISKFQNTPLDIQDPLIKEVSQRYLQRVREDVLNFKARYLSKA